ncbi:GH92 family glycosyl hydrolase [uncultured Paraglaciecola sp.]|uniref:GH92 family glycosyl hydrolase n=1 Tax=uncultured Paraglaciecola sp. TaxID=1765024 RepID=UPI0030DA0864|tara:strand:- start:227110 stop:229512 length:2403 start_codon:yes stop_codon:yes gene_type:complete
MNKAIEKFWCSKNSSYAMGKLTVNKTSNKLGLLLASALLFTACSRQVVQEVEQTPPQVISQNQDMELEPVDYVWPWLDSANSRWFYFNSATRPFGMVNLSPDTEIDGAWGSGYRYNTTEVKGFNHVHAWQLSGLSVMPISSDKAIKSIRDDYYSKFSHDRETVKAGYHKLTLDRYAIDVELTSTTRVGFHRYHYSKNQNRKVLFDLQGKFGPVDLTKGAFAQINERAFSGFVINEPTIRRPRPTPIYFYIETNTDVSSLHEQKGAVLLDLADSIEPLLMKVAISYVDEQGAKNNLDSELAHWNFEQVVQQSRSDWNAWLSKVKVEGENKQAKVRFYTDLFHALQGRRIISDVDGRYADQTSETRVVKQLPLNEQGVPQFNHHNSDSLWGAQWTIQTLWPLAYPKVASDFSRSFLQMYQDGGYIPRGPSGGNYTHVMTGAQATPFFVSNYMKGIRDLDIELAYQGLKKNHLEGGTMGRAGYEHTSSYSGGLEYYIENGYVPYPLPKKNNAFHQDGAGQTLEYAFQDWTLGQLATALGKTDDANYFLNRGQNYRKLFDGESGFMRPRDIQGNWLADFDPYHYRVGFVESNASQMTWFVPQDYAGLADLMGGKEKAVAKLNTAFETAALQGFTAGNAHDEETNEENRRIPVNYGNQPSIQTAFIFNELGAPHLTQKWSRAVINKVYSDVSERHGFNGDEDQGLMGSLSVLMKIGLFQLDGGTTQQAIYQIGSPIFDRVEIELDDQYYPGKNFIIEVKNNSDTNIYIKTMTLNGKPLTRHYLTHNEIVSGGILELVMTSTALQN